MSHTVSLCDEGFPVDVQDVEGKSMEAELTIPYGYSNHYDFKSLSGKMAKCCIEEIQQKVHLLGTKKSNDCWVPTAGNCGYALSILLNWARQYPEAFFEVRW